LGLFSHFLLFDSQKVTMANQLRVTLISTELAYIVFAVSGFCSTIVNVRPLNRVAFFIQDFSLLAAQRPALNHPLRGWRQTALQSHPSDRY
jgi:hypothetical protein